jgi:hypothetical protein
MSATAAQPATATQPVIMALLPIMAAMLVAFLVVGLALPVLPLHVHQGLGLGAFVVGSSRAASSWPRLCRVCGRANSPTARAPSTRSSRVRWRPA